MTRKSSETVEVDVVAAFSTYYCRLSLKIVRERTVLLSGDFRGSWSRDSSRRGVGDEGHHRVPGGECWPASASCRLGACASRSRMFEIRPAVRAAEPSAG